MKTLYIGCALTGVPETFIKKFMSLGTPCVSHTLFLTLLVNKAEQSMMFFVMTVTVLKNVIYF